jgi:mevalonate pyrophosphate decarboxylase
MRSAIVKAPNTRKPRKPVRKIVMAIRVTEEELKNFDDRFVVNGTLRSEVMRRKLEITKTRRAKRGKVSDEAAYDYMRGILLKSSLIKISALVDSLNRFDDISQLVDPPM